MTKKLVVRGGLVLTFGLAAALLGWFAYKQSLQFFVTYNVTQLKGLALVDSTKTGAGEIPLEPGIPTPIPQTVDIGIVPQPWDGASRVTVLVMGIDYGDWSDERGGPSRTDTMILLTLDPLTLSGGILNIPRDLWVNIPGGYGYNKINTAYYLGELYQLPGGGPALARKTVEQFLGVPINYYAQIDFFAFEQFIDTIGGIEVDVPAEIKVDPIGKHNTVILQPGKQVLTGPVALAYARARYTDGGDFDRAQRQQQVILAMRDQVLNPTKFPELISKAPEIYNQLASGIHTDMSFEQAVQLAWLVKSVPLEDIRRAAIAPPEAVLLTKSPDGSMDVLKPVTDKIRDLRDDVFGGNTAFNPSSSNATPEELFKAEGARISVLNGTVVEGLAGRTQQYLVGLGANVTAVGNANELPNSTRLVDYTGNPYTLNYLANLMGVSSNQIHYKYNPTSEIDIQVVLGADWANSNPMP